MLVYGKFECFVMQMVYVCVHHVGSHECPVAVSAFIMCRGMCMY